MGLRMEEMKEGAPEIENSIFNILEVELNTVLAYR